MNVVRKVYNWAESKVDSPFALWWLAFLFCIESIFFIPIDPILLLYCLGNIKRSFFYATVATVSSVVGGVMAYFIGAWMWQSLGSSLVTWLISEQTFNSMLLKYKLYQNWAILIGGFLPIPYKAITLSAGYCRLDLFSFILFSFIARGARFFLMAGAIKIWGNGIRILIDKYFNQLVILFIILVVLSCLIVKA